jgi:hypothetical protein
MVQLQLGDTVFLATELPQMVGNRLVLDHLRGQLNEWAADEPGAVIRRDASISGTVTCPSSHG